jgi:predicted Zn-ribbon and HTH transcriptional regulator
MSGINPSKRYSKETSKKEAEDLSRDIEKALENKGLTSDTMFGIAKTLQRESEKLNIAIGKCKECQISYSNGELEGFCPEHEEISKEFRKMVKEILGK